MGKFGPLHMLSLMIMIGCNSWNPGEDYAATVLVLDLEEGLRTRSTLPDDQLVSDINLLIYNENGLLEEKRFLSRWQLDGLQVKTTLLTEAAYDIFVCANLGYSLPDLSRETVEAYRFHMAYPDEYSRGMPMCGRLDGYVSHGEGSVHIPLARTMARIDLTLDRSKLDSDVSFQVTSVRVGGCPSSIRLFGDSKAETAAQVFSSGFVLSDRQVQPLNRERSLGISETVSLYLLENMQGDLLDTDDEQAKILPESRLAEVCSYLEIRGTYHSESWHTRPGETLVYRFYLGDGPGNFDVCRNTACRVTVCLEGNGLAEESWRVDQEALIPETRFSLHPAAYNECRSGEDFHLWCEVSPADVPFEIEPVAWDDDEGVHDLYTFDIDPDGHGLTIHTWKGGSVMVYFKAGPPVDRDTLALLVIDP
mgnify:CR=1 FL=1